MKINKIYIISVIIFIIISVEISLRIFISPVEKKRLSFLVNQKDLYEVYSQEEMDKNISLRHEFHGGKCIESGLVGRAMNWHPRFGFQNKIIDIDCINKLFTKKTKNIIFFGGSIMEDTFTPNYLTSIENYAFKDSMQIYRSINLAVSGSRLSNELSKFIEYVPKIKNVDIAIFVDGINELHSIKFNGQPDNDFYWTAGVNSRIHKPLYFFFDLVIDRSKIIEIVAVNIFNYKSSRIARNYNVTNNLIEQSIEDYFYRKKIIKLLCDQLSIKCLFVIHPVFNTTKDLDSANDQIIKEYIKVHYPNNEKIVNYGYDLLRKDEEIIDLSMIYDGLDNIFIDEAHTNKIGAEMLGKKLFEIISKN